MKKIVLGSFILFVIYAVLIWLYLFQWSDTSIPDALKGTSADPATFMNERELVLAQEYSQIKDFLFFLSVPYEWLSFVLVLVLGFSRKFSKWAKDITKMKPLQTAIYVFWLSLLLQVFTFPLDWISYKLSMAYNITTQPFTSWMKDVTTDFWVSLVMMWVIVFVLYTLITKSPNRWWFYAWLLSIPFTLFITFIQPVVIDPLYNDFYPLKDKQLEEKILRLADEASIPTDHVYEVNMSEKTNSMNAYVTGIGANSRIVLWDTTLNKLSDNEILFIMAHEMGHYVKKHIYVGIASALVLSLVGLWVTKRLADMIMRRWGTNIKVKSLQDVSSLPLILLLLSVLTFAVSPATNLLSRHHEVQSDTYALELTEDKEAAIKTFQELSRSGLSQVNPPFLVKVFRYSHPTILERIEFMEEHNKEE
ncbi:MULTISPECIES: M48 family metallopeptidase [Bacillaceae]|uniref:M48 family metallopeptidase n=1 Tax=Bacillaceae TaxID=186817 RepID=UPI001049564F|nr:MULTISPECIES: M48 family metallopeptidase [Bacillaceae]MBY6024342.1 M48 family metallopeptidase [Nitratireductor sp. DP7N14-4]MDT2048161.1 M48 family metallopeptidase [Priestia flexa]TDB48528.1 M48 family peptidase [Bacillus sp. CBEL-1]USY55753.1 M48 family metallopeptidase [Bacillus sp. 1780r2a1]